MLHTLVDKAFMINLDRREDRLKSAKERCDAIGLQFERVSAVDGNTLDMSKYPTAKTQYWNSGSVGMCLSLIRLITKVRDEKLKSFLLLEDDVEFHSKINDFTKFLYKEVPPFEMLYFGINNNKPPIKVSENIYRVTYGYSLHCVIINESIYTPLIEALSELNAPADVIIAEKIHSRNKSYCFKNNLAYQAKNFSDILNTEVDYTFLRR